MKRERPTTKPYTCADHVYYSVMSAEAKQSHLEAKYCRGGRARAGLQARIESLVDTDGDRVLSCDEFNSGYTEKFLAHMPAWNHSVHMAAVADCSPIDA